MAGRGAQADTRLIWFEAPQLGRNQRHVSNWGSANPIIKKIQKKSLGLAHSLNHLFQERVFTFNPSEPATLQGQYPINLAQYCLRLPQPARASCDMARSEISDRMVEKIINDLGYVIGENKPETYNSNKCIGILIKVSDTQLGPRWACISKKAEICADGYTWSYIDSIWRSRII